MQNLLKFRQQLLNNRPLSGWISHEMRKRSCEVVAQVCEIIQLPDELVIRPMTAPIGLVEATEIKAMTRAIIVRSQNAAEIIAKDIEDEFESDLAMSDSESRFLVYAPYQIAYPCGSWEEGVHERWHTRYAKIWIDD